MKEIKVIKQIIREGDYAELAYVLDESSEYCVVRCGGMGEGAVETHYIMPYKKFKEFKKLENELFCGENICYEYEEEYSPSIWYGELITDYHIKTSPEAYKIVVTKTIEINKPTKRSAYGYVTK